MNTRDDPHVFEVGLGATGATCTAMVAVIDGGEEWGEACGLPPHARPHILHNAKLSPDLESDPNTRPADVVLCMPEAPKGAVAVVGGGVRYVLAKRHDGDTLWRNKVSGHLISFDGIMIEHREVRVEFRALRTFEPIDEPPSDLTHVQILLANDLWSSCIHRDVDNPQWWWHGAKRCTWAELRAHRLREVQ